MNNKFSFSFACLFHVCSDRMIEFYSIGWKYDHIVEHLTDSFEPVIVPKNFDYSIECDKIDWDNLDTKSRIEKRIELNRIINYQINSKN